MHDLEAALRGDPKVTQGAWNLQIFLFPLHPLSLVVGGIMPRKCWGNHHILMTIVLSSSRKKTDEKKERTSITQVAKNRNVTQEEKDVYYLYVR